MITRRPRLPFRISSLVGLITFFGIALPVRDACSQGNDSESWPHLPSASSAGHGQGRFGYTPAKTSAQVFDLWVREAGL